jgi:hypothetical protein
MEADVTLSLGSATAIATGVVVAAVMALTALWARPRR